MARSENNPLVTNAKGKIGNTVVLRRWGNDILLCKPPEPPKTESFLQRNNRQQFALASAMAKEALLDPLLHEWFIIDARDKKLSNPYTAAMKGMLAQIKEQKIVLVDEATHISDRSARAKTAQPESRDISLNDLNHSLQQCILELQQTITKVSKLTAEVQRLEQLQHQAQTASASVENGNQQDAESNESNTMDECSFETAIHATETPAQHDSIAQPDTTLLDNHTLETPNSLFDETDREFQSGST